MFLIGVGLIGVIIFYPMGSWLRKEEKKMRVVDHKLSTICFYLPISFIVAGIILGMFGV